MNVDNNLNCGFYKDLDENFEMACILAEKDFTHEELISMLQNGNIPEKQISALKLDDIKSNEDAEILINNLTGCDGKIREAVALKIYQFLKSDKKKSHYFIPFAKIFADASIDINGNICRHIADSVIFLKKYKDFSIEYTSYIYNYTQEAFDELDKFIFKDKKYVINKQLFKLYWCLEALSNFYEFDSIERTRKILEKCLQISEYTIREKAAKIEILSNEFSDICEKLKQDSNYYVRQACQI